MEQALALPADVVSRVCDAAYGDLFRQVWGGDICTPANVNAAYDSIALSIGLGEILESRADYESFAAENMGKQKVPTLRNVDKRPNEGFVKAYAHNGYFKSLKGIVHFYNTRDAKPVCVDPFTTEVRALAQNCWPAPEVPENVNDDELSNLP